MIDVVNTCHFFFADAAGSRSSRSRGGGATKSGGKANAAKKNTEVTSENNSRSSSVFGNGGGRKFQVRGRNFSGDSSELYPFNLDGPPAYGEVVPEPAFVTPIIGGMAYFYDNQYQAPAGAGAGSNAPNNAATSDEVLKSNIKTQIEYYFSRENLLKDFFLRRKMDPEGYLPVTLVASFNRVRSLTNDVTFIMAAVQDSKVVQIKDGRMRCKDDPEYWPLPSDQPDPVISPKPESQVDNATDSASTSTSSMAAQKEMKLSLNPNVPEFVPSFKAVDPVHDPDDEAGTDGDDEAEIVDNQIVKGSSSDNWVEVKNKKQDRKSLPKESFETPERKPSLTSRSSKGTGRSGNGDDDAREELEFQFDEDLDMPTGRQNKFSAM